jgi:hypothetical protein
MAVIVAAVGGGNFTDGATWVGGVAPTAADDAQLIVTSGNVTINSGSVCRSLDCTGYIGTLTHSAGATLTIGDGTAGAGNVAVKLVAGMTYTIGGTTTSIFNFISTSATQQTITSGGKTMPTTTINGVGSSYVLADGFTTLSGSTVTVTAGTFNTGNQTCSIGNFNISGSTARTVTLGSSVITITSTGGNGWNAATTTNLTFNANTSQILIAGNGNPTFQGGSLTYNRVDFTSSGGVTRTLNGNNTFADLRFTNTAEHPELIIGGNQTVSTNLTFVGNSTEMQRIYVYSSVRGTPRTITCNGSITLTNVDFTDIVGAGSASWSGTSVGDGTGNSGITFTTPVTRYWVGNGGYWQQTSHWSATSGGASGASMPLVHDTAIFDANSFSSGGQTVNVQNGGGSPNNPRICSMNWTGVTNTPAFSSGLAYRQFGDQTFVSGMTLTGTFARTFMGNGSSSNIIMAGLQWAGGSSNVNALGTINFADSFSTLSNVVFLAGTWNVLANLTATGCSFNGDITRTVNMGSGTWTVTGTSPWNSSSLANLTLNAETSTIKLTDNSASNKSFGFGSGSAPTYNIVWVSTGGAGRVDFAQSASYATFKCDAGRHIRFNASVTSTILTAAGWQVVGTSGNEITISSSTTTNHTISIASGIVTSNYLIISDSTASGGATFYAGANSTDNGGANSGWIFASYVTQSNSDTLNLSDAVIKSISKIFSDNLTLTDISPKSYSKRPSDTLSLSDATVKTLRKSLSDTLSLSEATRMKVNGRVRWYRPDPAPYYN